MNETSKWWYEQDGEQLGPVEKEELNNLIGYGMLKETNLVWQEGLPSWIPLKETEFKEQFRTDIPPPISGEAVNNQIVWLLAFAPIIGQVLESIFLEINNPSPMPGAEVEEYINYLWNTDFNQFWFVTIALNILLCFADEKKLKKAGHNTTTLGSAFLIPVYLYKRAKMLEQNNAYFWVWLITFIVTIG